MGAGVGALLRMDSDRFREAEPGCAWAAFSGWKRVGVSKWTGILEAVCCFCGLFVCFDAVILRCTLLY